MNETPNSMRLCISLFGRVNAGKSTLFNKITGQANAIVSPEPGTTTDPVTKAMELKPFGPVLLVDTAGMADATVLGEARMEGNSKVFDRADVAVIAVRSNEWCDADEQILSECRKRGLGVVAAVTFAQSRTPDESFLAALHRRTDLKAVITDGGDRDRLLHDLSDALQRALPADYNSTPSLTGDLVRSGDRAVLITPIDKEAPAGRMILPQVQTIRDILDHGAIVSVCRETEYCATLAALQTPPDLVICDSQVVDFMIRNTPHGIAKTTFSILFARLKGDLKALLTGADAIAALRAGDRILIAEGCTHHAVEDDIGRCKIPRWLGKLAGGDLHVTVCSGSDFPDDLSGFKLIIQCGGCMLNRRQVMRRIAVAEAAGVPITNYGVAIAACHGYLREVTEIFRRKK